MKVTIELDEDVIYGIALSKAHDNAYDKLSDCFEDMTESYAVAFADGMRYLKDLLEGEKDEKSA